ncbi:glycosyltransferase family 1 protein [Conexibacter sp. JD483]|uniref:glycosyltransferase family 4 protein n=1 Tax=unclassified Conexibacter TaxID=2627773 RepID=UPI002724839A|nr:MULTISPECIES: glycosyltransferase family 1 protein [unclassified Conexibacter]MDO8184054.1 glycosyltransferase family 1 protein [Conexibacter sp. CPCC 205706]MDO8197046.1 glycosyltransferase family 1 protein [Conexibacter sp. CPCC 205762]MDR9367962.1 glycosyltransferase family 1 protein [Conexibacter sp. JD483]
MLGRRQRPHDGGPLTIGLDCRAAVEERGGRGTVVREQLRTLAAGDSDHRYVLYARERWEEVALDERFRWALLPAPDPLWHLRAADRINGRCDVYLSTNSYLTAWFLRIPSVLMVMDMTTFDRRLVPKRSSMWIERATLPLALRRTAAAICISQATADDLIAHFPNAAPLAVVSPLAASEQFAGATDADVARVRERHDLDGPYVLSVGTLEPRKNLPRLIEAFASLTAQQRHGARLVLVGARGWERSELDAVLARHEQLVQVLGFVDEEDLPGLYRGAELFAYPSIYEGFGLPLLEAMHAGTAVLTSPVSSLPEVAGEAALYADPHDAGAIAEALARGLADDALRARLAAAGRARAATFSWERHVDETLAVLTRAVR